MTFAAGTLQADVLHLADGSRIVGTLEQLDATQAKLSGTFAGALTVPRNTIVRIETEAPVTVKLSDGAYLTGRLESLEADSVVVHVDELGPRRLELSALHGVYREDPLILQQRELAFRVEAIANVGVNLTSGNSDTENLHVDGQLVTRNRRSRYTIAGAFTEEESSKVLVKQNWSSLVKYDYFVSEKWFWFNSVTLESDEFADLDLRTALSAGMGYQFFDTDARSLSFEAGPSYVHENFETAEDDSYLGSRWALNYDQRVWKNLTFFHYNEGVLGLEDTDDLIVRSRTGLLMNITDHIIARIQTAIDWDRSPPEGTDATDYEHTLTVGYRF
jgi:putative salt-induced outer membrane protein YdiY